MKKNFETLAIHTPFPKKDTYNSLQFPIYECNAFEFDSAEAMADAFVGKTPDHAYSRITNPTVSYFEQQVMQLTEAFSATALNSGMAAISNVFFSIAYTGANIVTSPHLFGNTYSFFASTLKDFGVETRFCDLTNLAEVEKNIDEHTCGVYLEIITNPQLEVVDLNALSAITASKNVPLIADSTIVPFCAFKAKNWGVNIEVISSTKYISGGATSLGGLIIDYANFNWDKNPRLNNFSKQFGAGAFTTKLRKEIHRNLGAYMTPHVAHTQLMGMETLSLRFNKAAENCLYLAKKLTQIPQVIAVNYPGLENNNFHSLSNSQFGELPGAMLTFDLASKEACFSFLNRLKLIKRATNLFDNRSLIIHPASTIYGSFQEEIRKQMNISDNTIRLSVGLEDVEDLLQDIQQAIS
jgi:O-acetylhomoserine (thiol)-lyase